MFFHVYNIYALCIVLYCVRWYFFLLTLKTGTTFVLSKIPLHVSTSAVCYVLFYTIYHEDWKTKYETPKRSEIKKKWKTKLWFWIYFILYFIYYTYEGLNKCLSNTKAILMQKTMALSLQSYRAGQFISCAPCIWPLESLIALSKPYYLSLLI
jgi:hypothetical protein